MNDYEIYDSELELVTGGSLLDKKYWTKERIKNLVIFGSLTTTILLTTVGVIVYRNSNNMFRKIIASQAYNSDPSTYRFACKTQPISHKFTENGREYELKGTKYSPQDGVVGDLSRKTIIVYTGNNTSNGPSMASSKMADELTARGATVIGMDYRGFGESTLNGFQIGEKALYRDGQEVFRYATETEGVKPENLIICGFSMGGAIAAHVTADHPDINALALQSPISSVFQAAKTDDKVKRITSNPFLQSTLAAIGTFFSGSSLDTAASLRRLHEQNTDIRVDFSSGGDRDNLGLDKTHMDIQVNFANKTRTVEENGWHTMNPKAIKPQVK